LSVGERSGDVVSMLGLPGEQIRRPEVLTDLIAETLLGERDTASDLAVLGVAGSPVLCETELRERLVVGLLIGWGLRRVSSWGAWLYQATRPDWLPKPGPLLDRFLQQVRALDPLAVAARLPEATLPLAPTPVVVSSAVVAESGDAELDLLAEEIILRYFAAARRKWPMFAVRDRRRPTIRCGGRVWCACISQQGSAILN
jgi:hypothetical protein